VVTLCYTAAGITNAEFICGKAEDVLPSLMWRLSGQEVIVVVDPPRAGLRVFCFMSSLAFQIKFRQHGPYHVTSTEKRKI